MHKINLGNKEREPKPSQSKNPRNQEYWNTSMPAVIVKINSYEG